MFFNSRSILKLAFATAFVLEAKAFELPPSGTGHHPGGSFVQALQPPPSGKTNHLDGDSGQVSDQAQNGKRALGSVPVELRPISDPGVILRGRSEKREIPGNGCFDPAKHSTFFWGGYVGDNIYVANFTMSAATDDEFILPVENFAKRMKSISCGTPGKPIILEFSDVESLSYAKSAWKWIDDADINHFTLVTEPDMCYKGDNRSPYLVSAIKFNDGSLTAEITAEEKPWNEVAEQFKLTLGHEYVDPATANTTHPHLARREDGGKEMDISHTFNGNLFNFAKDSKETAGLALKADLELTTSGKIIADFNIEKNWMKIPTDVSMNVHPQGVDALMKLSLDVDGKLGKDFQWDMKPEIEIPVQALNIKNILEIGPYVTMGIHMGSSALEGTGTMSAGAKAKIKDDAKVDVQLLSPEKNSISGWQPDFEKIDPAFSAEISGNVRAWSELGVQIKAEVLGKWGYQAAIDSQLPYWEAKMEGLVDSKNGVCESKKTVGIDLSTNVGINVNLNAGKVNEAPSFEKDIFETSWPLFSTCIGVGDDKPEPTSELTSEPSKEASTTDKGPIETGTGSMSMVTGAPSLVTGTGTASGGWPMQTGNTTLLRLAQRRPTALYL